MREPLRRGAVALVAVVLAVVCLGAGEPPCGSVASPSLGRAEARVMLGRVLFWDEQLSATRTVACGTCHRPGAGGADPRAHARNADARSIGPDGVWLTADDVIGSPGVPVHGPGWGASMSAARAQVSRRRAPSAIGLGREPELFTDGRARGVLRDPLAGDTLLLGDAALELQVVTTLPSDVEMSSPLHDWRAFCRDLAAARPLRFATEVPRDWSRWIGGRSYDAMFCDAFGSPDVTPGRIAMAIAAYERTWIADRTPLDSLLAGRARLRPDEEAGRVLFDSLSCGTCHSGPNLTDGRFHYIGTRPVAEDSGRAAVSGQAEDLGAFRTPSLRNVSLRRSYMHRGNLGSLADVLEFYNRGARFHAANRHPLILPLGLTREQRRNLVAFLSRPLVDPRVSAEVGPFRRPHLYSESNARTTRMPEFRGVPDGFGTVPLISGDGPAVEGRPYTIRVSETPVGVHAVLVVSGSDPGVRLDQALGRALHADSILVSTSGEHGYAEMNWLPEKGVVSTPSWRYARWYIADSGAIGGHAVTEPLRFLCFSALADRGAMSTSPTPAVPPNTTDLRVWRPEGEGPGHVLVYDPGPATRLKLSVETDGGEEVRHLIPETRPAPGRQLVRWDGRDDRGRRVPPGTYRARLWTDRGERRIPMSQR